MTDREIINKIINVIRSKMSFKFGGKQGTIRDNNFNIKVQICFSKTFEISFFESLDWFVITVLEEKNLVDWRKTKEAQNYFYNSFIELPDFNYIEFHCSEKRLKHLLVRSITGLTYENFIQSKTYKLMVLYDGELKKNLKEKIFLY